jgi:hypothetical protein
LSTRPWTAKLAALATTALLEPLPKLVDFFLGGLA